MGTIEFSFEVTSWGTGNIKIYAKSGNLVFTESLKQFNTWHQAFRWNGRSQKGNIVPDGLYHFVLIAESLNGEKTIKREKYIRIDSSLIISLRNLWSGSSGLMYAETADVLPPLDFQLSMLSIGHSENINGSNYFRFPSILSIRVGLGSDFELGASGALIFENSDTTPFNFSLFLKKLILKKNLSILTLSMAGTLKLAYQGNTQTDIFTNPGGASLRLPLSLSMGLFHILYSPEVVVSYYRVIYPYSTSTTATTTLLLYSWMYHRIGILLDYGFLTGGLSLALRSTPFNYITLNRFRVLEPPFQTAMELNFMIPKTRAFVSLLVTAEIESTNSYYISGGIGLSYLY